MSRLMLGGTAVVLSLGLALGCSSEQQTDPATASQQGHDGHATEENSAANEAFADLSPADRKLALAQKMCPVSDHALGSMGTPIKVTVEGRDVFVCCAGCVDELKSKFAEYVAKLEK